MIPWWLRGVLGVAAFITVALVLQSLYDRGYKAGAAVVEEKWTAERTQRERQYADLLHAKQARYNRDLAILEEAERGLQTKLDAADRRGADLARRLRLAQAAALPPGPGSGSATPVPDGSPRVSGDPDPLGIALAAHLSACERDAARLTELQGFLRATEKP